LPVGATEPEVEDEMAILIVYGSKMGGTAGLADLLAEALRGHGFEVTVAPAEEIRDLGDPEAVVIGGALYANRWHKQARRFVRRHRDALQQRPVWLFSSGPLDDSATTTELPPTKGVEAAMVATRARGHRTFGGALPSDAKGFPASAMAKEKAGDWRDPDAVAAWAKDLAVALT
jgi:menaquinone-dependent protoporphyrinogen oxidase